MKDQCENSFSNLSHSAHLKVILNFRFQELVREQINRYLLTLKIFEYSINKIVNNKYIHIKPKF